MRTVKSGGVARGLARVAALLFSFAVTGARVAAAQAGATAPAPAGPTVGGIVGLVVDSLTSGRGLPAAEVFLGESPRLAVTDASGRFRMDSLAPGRYTVAFSHPTLDSLGIGVRPVAVTVTAGAPLQVLLATPSTRTVARALCPAGVSDTTGALVGSVREAEKGAPVAGARVALTWTNLVLGPSGAIRAPKSIVATTDASGVYRACGVPTNVGVAVRATVPSTMGVTDVATGSGVVQLGGGLGVRNLIVAVITPGRTGGGSGGAMLSVNVARAAGGTPIANAQVRVAGDTLYAISDAAGRARLANAPIGTRALEVRAVGYTPQLVAVDLRAGQLAQASVRLEPSAQVLDTVRVTGLRNDRWSATGFDERSRSGQGYYLDRNAIERRNALRFTDLLRTVPGVTIAKSGQFTSQIMAMRGTSLQGCTPAVFVDGVGFNRNGTADASSGAGIGVDDFLLPAQVEGIEVYPSNAGVPGQYANTGGCGTILVWTRSSRPPASR